MVIDPDFRRDVIHSQSIVVELRVSSCLPEFCAIAEKAGLPE